MGLELKPKANLQKAEEGAARSSSRPRTHNAPHVHVQSRHVAECSRSCYVCRRLPSLPRLSYWQWWLILY